jgi:hypothetical protein
MPKGLGVLHLKLEPKRLINVDSLRLRFRRLKYDIRFTMTEKFGFQSKRQSKLFVTPTGRSLKFLTSQKGVLFLSLAPYPMLWVAGRSMFRVSQISNDLSPKSPPAFRGVLGVKSMALGRHLVHRLSLQEFHRGQVA